MTHVTRRGLFALAGVAALSGCSVAPLVGAAPALTPAQSPTSPLPAVPGAAASGATPRFVERRPTGSDAYIFRNDVPMRPEFDGRATIESADGHPSWDRFSVGGDGPPNADNPRERAEYAGVERLGFGSDVWVSFHVRLGDFVPTTWMLLAQFHDVPDEGEFIIPPPLAFQLDEGSTGLTVYARSAPRRIRVSAADEQRTRVWHTPNFTRGVWHHIVLRVRFERTEEGRLDLWHNGDEVFAGDVPIGFNDEISPYFKYGLYRGAAHGLATGDFANVEIGHRSLHSRITGPLVPPVGRAWP